MHVQVESAGNKKKPLSGDLACFGLVRCLDIELYTLQTCIIEKSLISVFFFQSVLQSHLQQQLHLLLTLLCCFLTQICLSVVMGHLVELTGLPHYYIIVACVAGLAAILFSDKVVFNKKDLECLQSKKNRFCPISCPISSIYNSWSGKDYGTPCIFPIARSD